MTMKKFNMSPTNALRVALLKQRSEYTIFKAKFHQKLRDDKLSPLEMERLERERQKEKDRIEAPINASLRVLKKENEEKRVAAKLALEKKKVAAKLALEKMEKSVVINENVGVLKDMEMMGCRYLYEDTFLDKQLKRIKL